MAATVSVVIPAHDEAAALGRHLAVLHEGAPELDVLVVCNGCTDDSAAVARAVPGVRVLEVPQPSKARAVRAGNRASTVFPRVHLDADVELSGGSLRALVAPLHQGTALATAPRRVLPMEGCSGAVRWYYEVWERLPQVRAGLFGRGAFALSEEGQRRVDSLPDVLSDDLVASEAFAEDERVVVDEAVVVVRPPRRLADLVRRRVRVVAGNQQADALGLRAQRATTSPADLLRIGLHEPRLLLRMPVFLAVTMVSRTLARRAVRAQDFTTWHRDESSRLALAGQSSAERGAVR